MRNIFSIALLMGAGVSLWGCSVLWGGSTKPDEDNCVRTPEACGPGQYCNQMTEACEGDVPPDPPPPPPPPPPYTSFIFPGGMAQSLDFPRSATYSLVAPGAATIYYTLNGAPPNPGMPGTMYGQSPLTLGQVLAGTKIRWSADYGPQYSLEPGHFFDTRTTNPSPIDLGYIPDPAVFDLNGSSVVTVAPGTPLTGRLPFQAWQSTTAGFCPGCIIQFVVTAETIGAVGCLNTVSGYGSYPGQSDTVNFAFNAPMAPGKYRLYSGLTLSFSCDGTTSNGPDVGMVIVQ